MLEDYIIYMDMLYNGSKEDKKNISFLMCDLRGEGMVFQEDYTKFCIEYLRMYEDLTQIKTRIDDIELNVI